MKTIAKLTVITVGLFFCLTATVKADLISYEGFDYTDGQILNNQSGGSGWADDWTGASSLLVDSPGLTYTTNSYQLVVSGNSIITSAAATDRDWRYAQTNGFMDSCLWSTTANGWCFGKAGTTNWLSFIIKQMDQADLGGQVSLHEGGTWGGNERIMVGYVTGFNFEWTLKGGGKTSHYAGLSTTNARPAFLVLRVINFANLDDSNTMDLWINPDLTSVPTGDGNIHHTGCDSTLFNRLHVGSGLSEYNIDEIRLGQSWDDVVPVVVPEPATLSMLLLSLIGFVAYRRR